MWFSKRAGMLVFLGVRRLPGSLAQGAFAGDDGGFNRRAVVARRRVGLDSAYRDALPELPLRRRSHRELHGPALAPLQFLDGARDVPALKRTAVRGARR